MGETGAGVALLFVIIVASKLIVALVITTLGLLHLFGANGPRKHWTAIIVGLAVGCTVSFVGGAADGVELRTSVFNLIFTIPPALVAALLWSFARPETDGYRSTRALFAYVGLWLFLGSCVVPVPFSLI